MKHELEIANIGQLIKDYREKLGYSQQEFAKQCGLHCNQISRMERGISDIHLSSLISIFNHANKLNNLLECIETLQG